MERIVAQEIIALAALAQVEVGDIQHFIAGISGTTRTITFDVPGDHCAVVVALEEFNVDEVLTHTTLLLRAGAPVTEVELADWRIGADMFAVHPPGQVKYTLVATPQGGKSYRARLSGYFLPFDAYKRLSRMSTKIIS